MNATINTSNILQAILDNAADNIVFIDQHHKVIVFNDVAKNTLRRIHGKALQQGSDYREFVLEENRQLYAESFEKAMNGETVIVESETRVPGISLWFQFKLKPVHDGEGALLGIMLTATNIDERKRKEIALQHAQHLLNERVKELSVIYQLHNILQNEQQSADEIFTRIVNLLPQGWRYTDICEAKIEFNGKTYRTSGFKPSEYCQRIKFRLEDDRDGSIEVVYTGESTELIEAPFLKEERDLLRTVSDIIQIYFNKKAHQDALEHSEARFRSAFEYAATGMAVVSLRGDWLMVNKTLCEMTGYSEDEMLKMTFQKITHPDDVAKDLEVLAEVRAGKRDYYQAEKRYIHKNGSTLWVNLSIAVVKDDTGAPLYYVSQVENVTERKTFWAELIKSEANMRSIFDNTQVGYMLLDHQRDVVAYNQYFLTRYFQQTEYMLEVGKNLLDLMLPEKRNNLKKVLDVVQATAKPIEYETKYANKEAASYFSVTVSPIINDEHVIGFCFCAFDITNRKNMEMERQKVLADLINRNKDLHEFAQIVSHNIRGPLAAMLGLTNMLDDDLSAEEMEFILKGVGTSANKVDAVVREMNHILHAKSETTEPKVDVDMNTLMEEVKSEFASTIAYCSAEINCDFIAASQVSAIRSFLHNILYNLLSNSLQYRHKERAPHIRVATAKTPEGVMISFADNGIGIDMDRHGTKIFTLNKRFQNTAEGKGLGLFIAKAQVDALGGSIKVESTPNVGTTFRVTLPA